MHTNTHNNFLNNELGGYAWRAPLSPSGLSTSVVFQTRGFRSTSSVDHTTHFVQEDRSWALQVTKQTFTSKRGRCKLRLLRAILCVYSLWHVCTPGTFLYHLPETGDWEATYPSVPFAHPLFCRMAPRCFINVSVQRRVPRFRTNDSSPDKSLLLLAARIIGTPVHGRAGGRDGVHRARRAP